MIHGREIIFTSAASSSFTLHAAPTRRPYTLIHVFTMGIMAPENHTHPAKGHGQSGLALMQLVFIDGILFFFLLSSTYGSMNRQFSTNGNLTPAGRVVSRPLDDDWWRASSVTRVHFGWIALESISIVST